MDEEKQIKLATSPEYNLVQTALSLLETQRKQTVADIQLLQDLKAKALANPMAYVNDLVSRKSDFPTAPKLQKVIAVPDLPKYNALDELKIFPPTLPRTVFRSYRTPHPQPVHDYPSVASYAYIDPTIASALLSHQNIVSTCSSPASSFYRASSVDTVDDKKSHLRLCSALKGVKRERENEGDGERDFGSPGISAGSEADEIDVIKDKPRRGNRSIVWTDEEQEILERIYMENLHEPVKERRFQRISEALGNRTVRQVGSRVQHWLKKAARLGITSLKEEKELYGKPKAQNKKVTGRKLLNTAPILMSQSSSPLATVNNESVVVVHIGFKCDKCSMDPIIGIRYSCTTCKVDICEGCYQSSGGVGGIKGFFPGLHERNHEFTRFDSTEQSKNNPDEFAYLGF